MSYCIDYCGEDDVTTHLVDNCPRTRQGGASSGVLLSCDAVLTDPTDGTEILALIAAGNAWKFTFTNISYGKPTAKEQPSNVPCQPAEIINYAFAGVIKDDNVNATNIAFWNAKNGRKFGGMLIAECGNETNMLKYINQPFTLSGGDMLPDNADSNQMIEMDFKGEKVPKNSIIWSVYDMPVGVF